MGKLFPFLGSSHHLVGYHHIPIPNMGSSITFNGRYDGMITFVDGIAEFIIILKTRAMNIF